MRIILFRHGPAGHRDPMQWPDDALRPLTPEGHERTLAAARGLAKLEDSIDAILTSPLTRARQTAEVLKEVVPAARLETLDALGIGGSQRQILRRLRQADPSATVALVGHEPDLGLLAGRLVHGTDTPFPFKKAGACIIDYIGPVRQGQGLLIGFYPPRVLRRIAGKRSKA